MGGEQDMRKRAGQLEDPSYLLEMLIATLAIAGAPFCRICSKDSIVREVTWWERWHVLYAIGC